MIECTQLDQVSVEANKSLICRRLVTWTLESIERQYVTSMTNACPNNILYTLFSVLIHLELKGQIRSYTPVAGSSKAILAHAQHMVAGAGYIVLKAAHPRNFFLRKKNQPAPAKQAKAIPDSRPKWAESAPVFSPKRPKYYTLWGGTYLYGL